MVDVDKAIIARIRKEGRTFEILVDCDNALELKKGKDIPMEDIVATDDIFKDVKKGEKASENELKTIFNTNNPSEIAAIIIKKGEIQLTQDHKEKLREELRKKIVNLIHKNAVDSQTGLPHPTQRIENAMNEARVKINDYQSAEEQIEKVLSQLKPIIPIKFEVIEVTLKIPAKFAGQSFSTLKKYKLLKDSWDSDGSLIAVVEIPAGIQEEFFNEINKITHGETESSIERKG